MALSVWHDEAKGLINGVRLPQRDNGDNSDADSDADVPPPGDGTAAVDRGAISSSQPSSPARSLSPSRRRRSATSDDSERESDGPSLSSDASRPPPSSPPDRDEAATELDALLEEEALHAAAHTAQTNHAWKKPQASADDANMDADDDLWAALDTSAAPTAAPAPPNVTDGDEEMWDVVAELEQEREREGSNQSNPVQDPPAAVDPQVDDMDDLYL